MSSLYATICLHVKYIDSYTWRFGVQLAGEFREKFDEKKILFADQRLAVSFHTQTTCILPRNVICNSDSLVPSYILRDIGLTEAQANKSLRICLNAGLSEEDVQKAVDTFVQKIEDLNCVIF